MRRVGAFVLFASLGCSSPSGLEVNLRTDYAPGSDFDTVRLCMEPDGVDAFHADDAGTGCTTLTVDARDHFEMGRRLASLGPVAVRSTLWGELLSGTRHVDERRITVRPGDGIATLDLRRPIPDAGLVDACMPRTEVCDLEDNDCDAQCDEGATLQCFVAIQSYRYGNNHIYTRSPQVPQEVFPGETFSLEGAPFRLATASLSGLVTLFRCKLNASQSFLTTDDTCENNDIDRRPLGYLATTPVCGSIPLYRFLSMTNADHLYQTSDRAPAGYQPEGLVGYVWP